MCTPDSALTGLVHCLAETTSQVGSHAVAVTSPGKSMVAGAAKGRGIGRGNFYRPDSALFSGSVAKPCANLYVVAIVLWTYSSKRGEFLSFYC